MGQCMASMMGNMNGSMIAIMGLSLGFGVAVGLAALAGVFYLIWRFVRTIEKSDKLNDKRGCMNCNLFYLLRGFLHSIILSSNFMATIIR